MCAFSDSHMLLPICCLLRTFCVFSCSDFVFNKIFSVILRNNPRVFQQGRFRNLLTITNTVGDTYFRVFSIPKKFFFAPRDSGTKLTCIVLQTNKGTNSECLAAAKFSERSAGKHK